MGWLIMTVVIFMLSLGSTIDFSAERRDRGEFDQAGVMSSQLAAWHQAAVGFCQSLPGNCPAAGPVDVKSTFLTGNSGKFAYTVFENAPAYTNSPFTSVVDPTLKIVVTFYRATNGSKRWNGQMVAAMTATQGWNVTMGQYDAARQQVDRADILEADNPALALARVPNNVGGIAIPDGSPIIVTRYLP
ncbi:hypothetical protein ACVIGB_000839 [Bradyrhizobium sp. USDA 4341]